MGTLSKLQSDDFSGPGDFQKPKTPKLDEKTVVKVLQSQIWKTTTRDKLTLAIPTVLHSFVDLCVQLETHGLRPTDLTNFDSLLKSGRMVSHYLTVLEIHLAKLSDIDPTIANKHFNRLLNVISDLEGQSRLLGYLVAYARYGLMEKYLKWSTATLWAKVLKQKELPPLPSYPIMEKAGFLTYTGINRRFWEGICKTNARTKRLALPLAKDLYMSKAASMPVPKGFVEESLEKHQKILCEKRGFDPLYDSEDNENLVELIEEGIESATREIFGNIRKKESSPPSRIPSLGSSYEYGRKVGGAFGELVALSDLGDLPQPEGGYLYGYARNPWKHLIEEVRVPSDPEIYFEAERASRFIALEREQVNATVIPLTEAFKVRTITKGDAHMYHLARRWQKVIHNRMRKHQNCALIGQPCSSAFLSQIFCNSELFSERLPNQGFFVSGDYESATDLLNPSLSEYTQEAIGQSLGIPLEDRLVLKKCLTKHALDYGEKDENGNSILYSQQWGQLMGSPTSFPVLCLINLAITRLVYEIRYERRFTLEELPICVNGDDVLFWSPDQEFYESWKFLTGLVGLKFSLGKNYTHKDVCIINSEMYYYSEKHPRGSSDVRLPFRKADTVNSQLLVGGSRSSAIADHLVVSMAESDLELYLSTLSDTEIRTLLLEICPRALTRSMDRRQLQSLVRRTHRGLRASCYTSGADLDTWARWYNTIEQRQDKLESMWMGDKPRSNLVKMKSEIFKVFRQITVSRVASSRFVMRNIPNYIPQSLGGLGLIAPSHHEYTPLDFLHVSACSLHWGTAEEWGRRHRPTAARSPFMEGICSEINSLSAKLQMPKVREYRENEEFRYGGEEGELWEKSFLAGFMNLSPAITADETSETMSKYLKGCKDQGYTYPKSLTRRTHKIMRIMKEEGEGEWEGSRLIGGLRGWTPRECIPEDIRIASHVLRPRFI